MYCIKAFAGLPQEKAMVLISAYVRLQQYHKLDNKNATSFLECLKELSSLFTSKNFADLAKLESTDKYIQQKNAILSHQPELAVCYDEVEPDDEPDLQDLEIELFIKLQMELEAIGLDLMNLPGSEELFKLNALKKVYDAIAKNLNIPTMVIDLPDMDTNIELADAIYAAEREECMEDDMKLAMKLYADEKHYSGGVVNIQDPNHAYERDLQVKREFDSYNEAPNHEYDPELSRAIDLSLNEGGKINSQQQPQRAATANAPALSLSQHMWNSLNYY